VTNLLNFAISDSAFRLIVHAQSDIVVHPHPATRVGRITTKGFGASTAPEQWLRETAILRLVSVIEAFVDALSMHRMGKLVDSGDAVVARMLREFELSSSISWQNRHDTYRAYHGISLPSQSGWQAVKAGIEVRNCIAHGLGNLTAQQRSKSNLASVLKPLDVTVGGNRMHITEHTIPTLGMRCRGFVTEVDAAMNASTAP
jgi:hypothetical protein